MNTDILSEVLSAVHLKGAVYFEFNVSPPWAFAAPPSREIAEKIMPGAQRVIEYHLIARGSGWGYMAGQPPIRLHEGDLIVFPQGDAHVICSSPDLPPTLDMALYSPPFTDLPLVFDRANGQGEQSSILCCFLGCDETPFNPLLASLPRVLHLDGSRDESKPEWLGTLLSIATSESVRTRAGGQTCWHASLNLSSLRRSAAIWRAYHPVRTGGSQACVTRWWAVPLPGCMRMQASLGPSRGWRDWQVFHDRFSPSDLPPWLDSRPCSILPYGACSLHRKC
jgi:Cupin